MFRACMLFPYGEGLGAAKRPTELVQARLTDAQWRGLHEAGVVRRLRNPDLAAVPDVHGWRFII